MRFRDKVKKPRRPVVVYEILPPREQDGTLSSYAERISSLLSQTHIDAINIPEVHDEEGRGNRPVQNQLRAEPREFGLVKEEDVEFILDRFAEEHKKSFLRQKIEIDNTDLTPEETLAKFVEAIQPHLSQADRARILTRNLPA